MSYVITQPETLVVAASELAGVGSAINTATAAAAGPTTSLLAAAADEVSAAVVKLFGGYSQEFQGLVAQAAAFHDELTRALSAAASAYVDAEVANMAAAFALQCVQRCGPGAGFDGAAKSGKSGIGHGGHRRPLAAADIYRCRQHAIHPAQSSWRHAAAPSHARRRLPIDGCQEHGPHQVGERGDGHT
ncbi:PE family protein [Mycobacterium attenuatum]|uniref:PE family protein n=1 Tax=Mycobacterium attenuatum TaxID=2341086 RepID=UPI003CC7C977